MSAKTIPPSTGLFPRDYLLENLPDSPMSQSEFDEGDGVPEEEQEPMAVRMWHAENCAPEELSPNVL